MTQPAALRLSVAGRSGSWHAVLMAGRRELATCGHTHRNRDSGQGAARHCGQLLMTAARDEETAARFVQSDVESAARARALGARWRDEEAREKAEAVVAAWRDVVLTHDFHLPKPSWVTPAATCGCCRISDTGPRRDQSWF